MRKVTSSILIGLACTSILSLSAGVQSVKADGQEEIKQTQIIKQSELQDANYTVGNLQKVVKFQGNNLKNGGITNKTTQLAISINKDLGQINPYQLKDASGNLIYDFKTGFLNGQTFDIPALKAGETYTIRPQLAVSGYYTLKFKVVSSVGTPTINKVTSQDASISGTGVAGATVNLTIAGDTYTGTVDASGNYNISLNKTYAVNSAITVTQEKDGITSDAATATVVEADKLPLPTVNTVTAGDSEITGIGVPGAIIFAEINGGLYPRLVDLNGKFRFEIEKLPVGTVIIIHQELNGNKSDSVTTTVVAPEKLSLPTINKVTAGDQTVTGTGVVGATVNLTIAGDIYTGTVDASGKYDISLNKTYAVNSAITVTQEKDGVTSDAATATVVAPEQLDVPTVNKVTDKDTIVTGTATPGATVHLTVSGLNFQTTASANGEFSINIEKNYPVNTPIEVYQELSGVKSETTEIYVQLTANFIIDKIKSNATSITGSGHPNAQLSVQIDDEVFTGTVDGNGKFTINLNGAAFKVGTDVTITSVSSEGKETATVKIYPQDPVIGVVFAADDEIRGTADPGATVIIIVGSTQYQTTVDSEGKFRQSVNPNLVASEVIVTVYSTINGYESEKVTTKVD